MKTAVIYARYSSDKQTEQSIEGQLRVCQEYAQKNDMVIIDTYIDRATTGTNDNRAAFQQLIKDSNNKQWNYVIVYKLDRFSRNKYATAINKKTLRDNGVKLISATENIPETPEGIILESLLEGMAEYYSAELSQKVQRGIRESWLKGNFTGNKLFGYDVINKKYVINEYEAEIVRKIFTKYAQGYNGLNIVKELKEEGVVKKNGKPITDKNIYRLLHNPRYTGKVEHDGVVYDNIFPAIISEDLWRTVSLINEENKHAKSRKKDKYNYLLAGKIVCGKCNHILYGDSGTNTKGELIRYYVCSSKRKKRLPCDLKSLRKEKLEDLVIKKTCELINCEENINFIAKHLNDMYKENTSNNTKIKMLEKQKVDCEKAANNILVAIEQGIITDFTKDRLSKLQSELNEIKYKIEQEKQKTNFYISIEDIKKYIKSKVILNTEDIQLRKLLVNAFVKQVIVKDNEVTIIYNSSDKIDYVSKSVVDIEETKKQIDSAFYYDLNSGFSKLSAPVETLAEHARVFLLNFFII